MKLTFMEQPPLHPELLACPHCQQPGRIGVHNSAERRYMCHACKRTFTETKGTPLHDLKYPIWVVVLVLTLLAYGCPIAAIVAAFLLDERTVLAWQSKAGTHAEQVQATVVCNGGVTLGQVQADELCVNTQHGKVWMATAMSVFTRLFLWGEVAQHRDTALIDKLFGHVRRAANGIQPILVVVDGFAAYPKIILKHFATVVRSGKVGRPPRRPWADLHIAQVVKQHSGRLLTGIERRVVHGCRQRIDELIALSQCELGRINTAFIERLNATFRARLPALARRTRNLAQGCTRLRCEMFWSGAVYNFCTVHGSLGATPTMAADLTDHVWSIRELLLFKPPAQQLHAVV
jgi:transposase-like protein